MDCGWWFCFGSSLINTSSVEQFILEETISFRSGTEIKRTSDRAPDGRIHKSCLNKTKANDWRWPLDNLHSEHTPKWEITIVCILIKAWIEQNTYKYTISLQINNLSRWINRHWSCIHGDALNISERHCAAILHLPRNERCKWIGVTDQM